MSTNRKKLSFFNFSDNKGKIFRVKTNKPKPSPQ